MNFFIAGCYVIIKIYANEIFPTKIRVAGYSSSSIGGLIGNCVAPFLGNTLSSYHGYGPFIYIAVASLFGSICSYFIPYETSQKTIDSY